MSTTEVGRAAEDVAAGFLCKNGFEIIAQNWRTRWCEIDIIAQRSGNIYFVEVKYRGSSHWGSGLDYITPKKLRQMQFAAEFWCAAHKSNADYYLSAIEASGHPPRVIGWVEDV